MLVYVCMFLSGLWEKTDTLLKKIMFIFALEEEKDSDFDTTKCENNMLIRKNAE